MGQANKRGTFSQRLDAAHRKAADEIVEANEMQQKIIEVAKETDYIAKQLIMSHWKHTDISHRAAFSATAAFSAPVAS